MKVKIVLLVIGLSFFNTAVGAVMSKKESVNLRVKHSEEQRNPISHDFYVYLSASQLNIEQNALSGISPFTVTLVKVGTDEAILYTASYRPVYSVDLSLFPSGEYRIEIETEFVSVFGYFTLLKK